MGLLQEQLSSRTAAAAGGLATAAVGTLAVLALLRWRLKRLSGPTRALIRANRYRFTFVTAPLRVGSLIAGTLLITLGPHPPTAVEIAGPILLAVPFMTLVVRWRRRLGSEMHWLARRWWFRLRRRPTSPADSTGIGR